jgi:hypothetical protein
MLNRMGPTHTSDSIYNVSPPPMRLNFSETNVAVGVRQLAYYTILNLKKYFDLDFRFVTITEGDDEKTYEKTDSIFKIESCRADHFDNLDDNKNFTDEYLVGNELMCLDRSRLMRLQGQYSSNTYSFLDIAVWLLQ